MRTTGIWVAGLLASGIFGSLIAEKFLAAYPSPGAPEAGLGVLGGMLAFTCLRLWLASPQQRFKLRPLRTPMPYTEGHLSWSIE